MADLVEEMARAAANAMDVDPDVFIGMHGRHKWEKQWHPVGQACLAVVEERIEELTDLPRLIELNRTAAPDCPREDGWNAGLDYAAGMVRAALPSVVLKGNSNG